MKEAKHVKKLFFNRIEGTVLIALFAFSTLGSQVRSISGVVKDPSGETIIGA